MASTSKSSNDRNNLPDDLETSPSTSTKPCRLSWFLVKNDKESAARHGDYVLIHAVDILNHDPNNVFADTIVRYNLGRDTLTAKVLAAADKLEVVQNEMKEWLEADRRKSAKELRFVMVQYRLAAECFVTKVLNETEVTPALLGSSQTNCKDVFLSYGEKMVQGYVLSRNNNPYDLENELIKLKGKCYEAIRSSFAKFNIGDDDPKVEPKGNPWLLVQYSRNLSECVHTIARYDDTQKLASNKFPGAQVFLKFGNVIYQAMILLQTHNIRILVSAINNIEHSCFISVYPKRDDVNYRNAELVKYERPDLHQHKTFKLAKICKADLVKCRKVTKKIEKEAALIYNLFDKMDQTEQQMLNVLIQLKKLSGSSTDASDTYNF